MDMAGFPFFRAAQAGTVGGIAVQDGLAFDPRRPKKINDNFALKFNKWKKNLIRPGLPRYGRQWWLSGTCLKQRSKSPWWGPIVYPAKRLRRIPRAKTPA
jgi:hypothetical protein